MADICGICEHEFQNFPRIELGCHHSFHTHCFLANVATANPNNLLFLHCTTCEQPVFAQQEELEQEQEIEDNESVPSVNEYETQRQRVLNLWDTNEAFRKDVKNYRDAHRAASKPREAFSKLITLKKRELKTLYTPIKMQIEGLYYTRKDQITQSEEYKAFSSARNRYMRYYNILRQRYNLGALHYLRERPGLRSLQRPRYRDAPSIKIRRALRFRFGSYY